MPAPSWTTWEQEINGAMIERLPPSIAHVIAMLALSAALALSAVLVVPAAHAQPVDLPIPAATTDQYPPGVTVKQTSKGPVYADAQGHTLYGMDMRTLVRWSADAAQYCQAQCAETWQAVLAPPDAKPNVLFPRGFGQPPARPAGAPGAAALGDHPGAAGASMGL
jgi:predicted lipoprotein with Yx(FWY)xxD motif